MKVYKGLIDITNIAKNKEFVKEVEFKDGIHKLLNVTFVIKNKKPTSQEKESDAFLCIYKPLEEGEERKTDPGLIIGNFWTLFYRQHDQDK